MDRTLFSGRSDRLADDSQLKYLGGDRGEANCATLEGLPEMAQRCEKTGSAWRQRETENPGEAFEIPRLDAAAIGKARRNASAFIRKENPSGLELPIELPSGTPSGRRPPPRSLMDNPATLYGSWWHTLFQHLPWNSPETQWEQAFAQLLPASPDAARSVKEWKLFRGSWRKTALAELLGQEGTIAHTEYPFLWRMNEKRCLEGVIDLLLVNPAAKRALLVDWKTNAIGLSDKAELQQEYRPQLAAYWRAVHKFTGCRVVPALYATALGALLVYSEEEMTTEWQRLGSGSLV
jgi:ATP-dependent exoDNAse (exonuclease V) beta subunit